MRIKDIIFLSIFFGWCISALTTAIVVSAEAAQMINILFTFIFFILVVFRLFNNKFEIWLEKKPKNNWWRKHIVDTLPPDEDEEFSEKYRK